MFYEIKDPFSTSLVKSLCIKTAHGLAQLHGGQPPKHFECEPFVWNLSESKWESREIIRIPAFSFSIAWNGEMDPQRSHVLINQKNWSVKDNITEEDENGELIEVSGLDWFVEMEQMVYDCLGKLQLQKYEEDFKNKTAPEEPKDNP